MSSGRSGRREERCGSRATPVQINKYREEGYHELWMVSLWVRPLNSLTLNDTEATIGSRVSEIKRPVLGTGTDAATLPVADPTVIHVVLTYGGPRRYYEVEGPRDNITQGRHGAITEAATL